MFFFKSIEAFMTTAINWFDFQHLPRLFTPSGAVWSFLFFFFPLCVCVCVCVFLAHMEVRHAH